MRSLAAARASRRIAWIVVVGVLITGVAACLLSSASPASRVVNLDGTLWLPAADGRVLLVSGATGDVVTSVKVFEPGTAFQTLQVGAAGLAVRPATGDVVRVSGATFLPARRVRIAEGGFDPDVVADSTHAYLAQRDALLVLDVSSRDPVAIGPIAVGGAIDDIVIDGEGVVWMLDAAGGQLRSYRNGRVSGARAVPSAPLDGRLAAAGGHLALAGSSPVQLVRLDADEAQLCPGELGGARTVRAGNDDAAGSTLTVLVDGARLLRVELETGSCRSVVLPTSATSALGDPVSVGDHTVVADVATGEVLRVDWSRAEPTVQRVGVGVPGRPIELLAKSPYIVSNDPAASTATVVVPGTRTIEKTSAGAGDAQAQGSSPGTTTTTASGSTATSGAQSAGQVTLPTAPTTAPPVTSGPARQDPSPTSLGGPGTTTGGPTTTSTSSTSSTTSTTSTTSDTTTTTNGPTSWQASLTEGGADAPRTLNAKLCARRVLAWVPRNFPRADATFLEVLVEGRPASVSADGSFELETTRRSGSYEVSVTATHRDRQPIQTTNSPIRVNVDGARVDVRAQPADTAGGVRVDLDVTHPDLTALTGCLGNATWLIDYGDGSPTETFQAAWGPATAVHRYTSGGPFSILASVSTGANGGIVGTATSAPVNPIMPLTPPSARFLVDGVEVAGQSFPYCSSKSVTWELTGATASEVTSLQIETGQFTPPVNNPQPGAPFAINPIAPQTYVLRATATLTGGRTVTTTNNDAQLTIEHFRVDIAHTVGPGLQVDFTFSPLPAACALDQAIWSISYGDSSSPEDIPAGPWGPISRTHVYDAPGDYLVSTQLSNGAGDSAFEGTEKTITVP